MTDAETKTRLQQALGNMLARQKKDRSVGLDTSQWGVPTELAAPTGSVLTAWWEMCPGIALPRVENAYWLFSQEQAERYAGMDDSILRLRVDPVVREVLPVAIDGGGCLYVAEYSLENPLWRIDANCSTDPDHFYVGDSTRWTRSGGAELIAVSLTEWLENIALLAETAEYW